MPCFNYLVLNSEKNKYPHKEINIDQNLHYAEDDAAEQERERIPHEKPPAIVSQN
jgi:hypothetical protein